MSNNVHSHQPQCCIFLDGSESSRWSSDLLSRSLSLISSLCLGNVQGFSSINTQAEGGGGTDCLSASRQLLLLWSGINHLISPQACLCALPMI